MNKSIAFLRSAFFSLVLMSVAVDYLQGQAAESPVRVIPKTPEAATFEKFLNFPNINSTGIPEINIPLYTLNYKGFTLPISISYHSSGVKVNDIATPVGLNWILNTGGYIYRDIIGLADELNSFVIDSVTPTTSCNQDLIRNYYEGIYDAAPDIFNYVIPGRSGKFIIKPGSIIKKSKPDPVKIVPTLSPLGFYVTDEFGNKYTFLATREYSAIDVIDFSGGVQSSMDHLNGSGYVGWKLDKITLPTGDEILFTYIPYNYVIDSYRSSDYYTYSEGRLQCEVPATTHRGGAWTYVSNQTYMISTISTPVEIISFEYETADQCSIFKKRLKKISVKCNINTDTVQNIVFNHGIYDGDPRLKLNVIKFYGNSTVNPNPMTYSFSYQSGSLPVVGSCSQDIFGYLNSNTQTHMIPVNDGNTAFFTLTPANREVSPTLIKTGILTEIQYPTGGKIRYTYEPNSLNTVYAPGVRVKTIEFLQGDGSLSAKKQFEYIGLNGKTHTANVYDNYYELRDMNADIPSRFQTERHWTSFPISYSTQNLGHYYGFYYGQVNVLSMNGTTIGDRTEELYSGYIDFFTVGSYLHERTYKDSNNQSVKKEIYDYSNNSFSYHGWTPYKSYQWYGGYYCGGTTFTTQFCMSPTYYAHFQTFNYTVNNLKLNNKTETNYFDSGTKSVTVEHDYLYNIRTLPVKITSSTSSTRKTVKYYHYPDDYSVSLQWLNRMKENDKHMVGLVIDERTYDLIGEQEYLLNSKINEYNEYGQITKEYFWKGSTPEPGHYWVATTFVPEGENFSLENTLNYNISKNIESITTPAMTTAFLWDYSNFYPVAKTENSEFNKIAFTGFESTEYGGWTSQSGSRSTLNSRTGKYSFVNAIMQKTVTVNSIVSLWVKSGSGTPTISGYTPKVYATTEGWVYYEWNVNPGSISVNCSNCYIDDLRLYPVGAMMTTYTYYPLVGMNSSTDPNGIITRYEYDPFGRLKQVKNNDNKISGINYYHYYNDPGNVTTPYLNISPISLAFGSSASSSTFSISSNGSWSITDNATWLTVNTTSGTGNATLTVSVAANTSTARIATITITYTGGLTKTVSVSQAASSSSTLTVNYETINFPAIATPVTVTVTSNTSWTVTRSDSWITLTATSGTGNGTVGIGATELVSGNRSGTVTFRTTDNTVTRIIQINQDSGLQQ